MSLLHKTSQELLELTKRFIPPLLPHFHKGQLGRVAVVGGCEDYTGAPFFSCHAALMMGCDLAHVVCEKNLATVVKSYSPDLMVHPYLFESDNIPAQWNGKVEPFIKTKVMPKVESLLSRMHAVVVGPGFGRDSLMLQTLELIVIFCRSKDIPLIIDLDLLYLLSQKPELIKGCAKLVITPNVVEFLRVAKLLELGEDASAKQVSELLGGVTVLQKGLTDKVVCGTNSIEISHSTGSLKRVGGQGDSVTGCIATLILWGFASYRNKLWDEAKLEKSQLSDSELLMLSCYSGVSVVRESAARLFAQHGRSMQTSHIHEHIGLVYKDMFE